jgi:hypothetical protein
VTCESDSIKIKDLAVLFLLNVLPDDVLNVKHRVDQLPDSWLTYESVAEIVENEKLFCRNRQDANQGLAAEQQARAPWERTDAQCKIGNTIEQQRLARLATRICNRRILSALCVARKVTEVIDHHPVHDGIGISQRAGVPLVSLGSTRTGPKGKFSLSSLTQVLISFESTRDDESVKERGFRWICWGQWEMDQKGGKEKFSLENLKPILVQMTWDEL